MSRKITIQQHADLSAGPEVEQHHQQIGHGVRVADRYLSEVSAIQQRFLT